MLQQAMELEGNVLELTSQAQLLGPVARQQEKYAIELQQLEINVKAVEMEHAQELEQVPVCCMYYKT